jgi:hypothetical protein
MMPSNDLERKEYEVASVTHHKAQSELTDGVGREKDDAHHY